MKTQRFAIASLVVLAVAAVAKNVDNVDEPDLYKAPPSLEEEIRGLKVREIKHRLRKRHGISPDKAVLDKSELVKLLVDAERAAIAKNLKDAGAKVRQEEKKNDAVRDFLMKTAAVVLGLAVVVAVFVPAFAASVTSSVRSWSMGHVNRAWMWSMTQRKQLWAAASCGPFVLVAFPLALGSTLVDLLTRAVSWSLMWRMVGRVVFPAMLSGPGGGAPKHWPWVVRAAAVAHVHCLRALPSFTLGSWDLGPMAALWGLRYVQAQVDALVRYLATAGGAGGGAPPPPPPPPPRAPQEQAAGGANDMQAMFAEMVRQQAAANEARAPEMAAQAEAQAKANQRPPSGFVPDYDFVVASSEEDSEDDEDDGDDDDDDKGANGEGNEQREEIDVTGSGSIADLD